MGDDSVSGDAELVGSSEVENLHLVVGRLGNTEIHPGGSPIRASTKRGLRTRRRDAGGLGAAGGEVLSPSVEVVGARRPDVVAWASPLSVEAPVVDFAVDCSVATGVGHEAAWPAST